MAATQQSELRAPDQDAHGGETHMDTAKVDIRKLQILNDRINQTIDALNQVRLSVHGLQHTGPLPYAPQYAQPQPFPQPFPQYAQPQAYPQYAQPYPYNPQAAILAQMAGLSHSNPYAQPYAQAYPYAQQAYAQQAYAQQAYAQQALAQQALAQQALAQAMNPIAQQHPWAQQPMGLGIGHSAPIDPSSAAWEAQRIAQDPWYPVRVQQAFPFANQPIPPSNGIV